MVFKVHSGLISRGINKAHPMVQIERYPLNTRCTVHIVHLELILMSQVFVFLHPFESLGSFQGVRRKLARAMKIGFSSYYLCASHSLFPQ